MNRKLAKTGTLIGWSLLLLGFGIWVVREIGIRSREDEARSLVRQLEVMIRMYERDWAVYPPGDGTGSRGLVERLGRPVRCKWFTPDEPVFAPGQLTDQRDLRSPLWPDEAVIHYREPGFHNRGAFDLWTEDATGRADGINNWEAP